MQARQSFATPPNLPRICVEAGLDGARIADAMTTRRFRADADRLQREARNSGHHPPELLVNGRRLSPWSGDDAIGRAIAEARTRADELLAVAAELGLGAAAPTFAA